jgi:polyhydroxybutyrate depolymerase
MLYGDFRPLASQDGFLIVAPDGQGAARHFNLTGEAGLQDDVGMVGALLDHLQERLCVDPARVYSTGMSDGGAMTSVLACRLPDRFAAFAPVAAIITGAVCSTSTPVAIMGFAGTADPVVPFAGGEVQCCGHPTIGGAADAMGGWASHNSCTGDPTDERIGTEVHRLTWNGCVAGSAVVFYIIDGGGHTWPGTAIPVASLGLTTQQVDASETIWTFFQEHARGG